ncbi:hypothetical protein [Paracidovorax anthurii]|uniref:hypothetical protein n=1 Tax=Paracidovorax anthurii TaxID=78229 RepID=UPI001FEB3001|nr:hypothetical protein [Paracidovorax anthurii]
MKKPDGRAPRSPPPAEAPGVPEERVVFWHRDAPAQPALGSPCNGCGLCCLAEPCPLGMIVSRRRSGACVALRWSPAPQPQEGGRYVCGMVEDPAGVTGWRSAWALRWLRALSLRWIAAGQGCDAPPLLAMPPPGQNPPAD